MKYVPKQMKELDNWGFWKKAITKDGKPTKLPLKAFDLTLARTNVKEDWKSFKYCMDNYPYVESQVDGLGFLFEKKNMIVFIDLDHCYENGVITEYAKNICYRFKDTYIEKSQSGNGIHIFCFGEIPKSLKTQNIEIYDDLRYVAFTGDIITKNNHDLCDYSEELNKLYEENKKVEVEYTPVKVEYNHDRYSILEKIKQSKVGYKFFELYNGNLEKNSENTLALASMLAFWCQKDASLMKEILYSSGMYREKFDRPTNGRTWIDLVIDKAIMGTKEIYKPQEENNYQDVNIKELTKELEKEEFDGLLKLQNIAIQAKKEREYTNIPELDYLLKGIEYGVISLWSGITNHGKSTLMMQIAKECIKARKKIFFFAGEHSEEDFKKFFYVSMCNKDQLDFITDDHNPKIYDVVPKPQMISYLDNIFNEYVYLYNNRNQTTIENMLKQMENAIKQDVRIFFIDNFMQIDNTEQLEKQTKIMEQLKIFAMSNNVIINLVVHPRKTQFMKNRLTIFDIAGTQNIANKSANICTIIRTDILTDDEHKEIKKILWKNGYNIEECDAIVEVIKTKGNSCKMVGLVFDKDMKLYKEAKKYDVEEQIKLTNSKKNYRNEED